MVVFEKGTYYRNLRLSSLFSCLRTQQIKEGYIFVCPFVKFLVWMKWLKVNPAFAILDNQWSGMVIYHFTTTKNRINQLQSTPRNMVANESARMAFDYHKPSKHLLQKSPWFKPLETAHFSNAITTGTHPSKSQKPMGIRFFSKQKKSTQLPYNEATHRRANISRLGNRASLIRFFSFQPPCFFGKKYPSQKHMSLSWLRSAFVHPQGDQLCFTKKSPGQIRPLKKEPKLHDSKMCFFCF